MIQNKCDLKKNESGREKTIHGSIAFPIACYEENMYEAGVEWHWHDDFEFIYVYKGSIVLLTDEQKIVMKEGTSAFISSGVLHSVEHSDTEQSILRSLVFNPQLAGDFSQSIFWIKYINPIKKSRECRCIFMDNSTENQKKIAECMNEAWCSVRNESFDYENFCRYKITLALNLISSGIKDISNDNKIKSQKDSIKSSRMKKLLTYIEMNYMKEINLDTLLEQCNISESSCLRLFKDITGITPIQFIKKYRIEKACQMLGNGEQKSKLSVTDIAFACGFNDISYFTKSFKEIKGITPGEYRNKIVVRKNQNSVLPVQIN